MTGRSFIRIERCHDGRYRVVEFYDYGFVVLGIFADRETAEARMAEWEAEAVTSN